MQLTFRQITIDDRAKFETLLANYNYETIETVFACLYLWRNNFGMEMAEGEEWIILRFTRDDRYQYILISAYSKLDDLLCMIEREQDQVSITTIDSKQKEAIVQLRPSWSITEDYYDYIYDIERIYKAEGRKYKSLRNMINGFKKCYPSHRLERLDDSHIEACIEITDRWCFEKEQMSKTYSKIEIEILKETLMLYDKLGLSGFVLFADNKAVAFVITYEPANHNTYFALFKKYILIDCGIVKAIEHFEYEKLIGKYKYANVGDDGGSKNLHRLKEFMSDQNKNYRYIIKNR